MTAIGIAIGLSAAALLTRYIVSVLYGVRPGDPLTYAIAAAVLLGVAPLATWLPARRATAVDPLVALRSE
jgi:ABC-type antimicrobial peptide transport system permease subunit